MPINPADLTNTESINAAADKIVAARVLTTMANNIKAGTMPPLIEIKGLGAAVKSAKAGIASVRAETAGLSSDATALVAAIQDVRTQISQAHADLKFESETLGNGGETTSDTASTVSVGTVSSGT